MAIQQFLHTKGVDEMSDENARSVAKSRKAITKLLNKNTIMQQQSTSDPHWGTKGDANRANPPNKTAFMDKLMQYANTGIF